MDIIEKVNEQLNALAKLTESAAKVAEEGKAARSAKGASDSFARAINALFDAEEGMGNLTPDALQYLTLARRNAVCASQALGGASGEDRTAGDKLARGLTMVIEQSWLNDHDEADAKYAEAEESVKAWNATAPQGKPSKGTRSTTGTGEPTKKDLPFPVTIKCESHPEWTATQSGTKNSLKWAAVQHHEKTHGRKFGGNDAIDQGVKDAINAVVDGAQMAQGGGYLVSPAR